MKTWQYVTIFAMLALILGYQKRLISKYDEADRRLAKCEADVMQWSKLAEYAAEFHAVPDPTAPIDSAAAVKRDFISQPCKFRAIDSDSGYPGRLETRVVRQVFGGGVHIDFPSPMPTFSVTNDNENKPRNSHAGNGPDTSKWACMWIRDEVGNESHYRRVNGQWVLQTDTLRITNGKE